MHASLLSRAAAEVVSLVMESPESIAPGLDSGWVQAVIDVELQKLQARIEQMPSLASRVRRWLSVYAYGGERAPRSLERALGFLAGRMEGSRLVAAHWDSIALMFRCDSPACMKIAARLVQTANVRRPAVVEQLQQVDGLHRFCEGRWGASGFRSFLAEHPEQNVQMYQLSGDCYRHAASLASRLLVAFHTEKEFVVFAARMVALALALEQGLDTSETEADYEALAEIVRQARAELARLQALVCEMPYARNEAIAAVQELAASGSLSLAEDALADVRATKRRWSPRDAGSLGGWEGLIGQAKAAAVELARAAAKAAGGLCAFALFDQLSARDSRSLPVVAAFADGVAARLGRAPGGLPREGCGPKAVDPRRTGMRRPGVAAVVAPRERESDGPCDESAQRETASSESEVSAEIAGLDETPDGGARVSLADLQEMVKGLEGNCRVVPTPHPMRSWSRAGIGAVYDRFVCNRGGRGASRLHRLTGVLPAAGDVGSVTAQQSREWGISLLSFDVGSEFKAAPRGEIAFFGKDTKHERRKADDGRPVEVVTWDGERHALTRDAPFFGRHVVVVFGEAEDAVDELYFLCANFARDLQYFIASRSYMVRCNGMMHGLPNGVLKLGVNPEDLTMDLVVEGEDDGEEEAYVDEDW
jgi:hypothetical protein